MSKKDIEKTKGKLKFIDQSFKFDKQEFILPEDYVVFADGKLFRETQIDKKPFAFVCDYVPHIETIYYNERENETFWTIHWVENGQVKRLKMIPKDAFSTSRKITELYGMGFSVTSVNASEMVKYFQRYEAMYKDEIETKFSFDQLGCIKGGFLLPDRYISNDNVKDIVFQVSSGDMEYIKAFTENGTIEEWLEYIFEPIKSRKIPLAFILGALGSPLLKYFNLPTFIMDISYSSSSGKTITIKVAVSVWGSWELHNTWYGTFAGIERRAVMLNHLPMFLDDTKNSNFRNDEKATIIYTLASGKEKTRSGLRSNHVSRHWNCIILSTGEQKITEYSNDGGTVARTLAIHDKPFEYNKQLVQMLEANTHEYYGTIGPAFLQWFVKLTSEQLEQYKVNHQEFEEEYASQTDNPIVKRTAKYMAFIKVIAEMMKDAFAIEIDKSLLDELWINVVKDTQDESGNRPLQALREVIQYCDINQANFYQKENDFEKNRAFGEIRKGDNLLCIEPIIVKEFLKNNGYDVNTILKQWKEKGYIKTKENQLTFPVWAIYHKKTKRYICINLAHPVLNEAD